LQPLTAPHLQSQALGELLDRVESGDLQRQDKRFENLNVY